MNFCPPHSPPFYDFRNVRVDKIKCVCLFVCWGLVDLCSTWMCTTLLTTMFNILRVCSSSKEIIIIYSTQTQTHIVFISNMLGDILK